MWIRLSNTVTNSKLTNLGPTPFCSARGLEAGLVILLLLDRAATELVLDVVVTVVAVVRSAGVGVSRLGFLAGGAEASSAAPSPLSFIVTRTTWAARTQTPWNHTVKLTRRRPQRALKS
jgi:hypothetical protein